MAHARDEAFGEALRQIRSERGLSQEQAALASGIDRSYFGKLEQAVKVPTLRTVWKVADALGVQPSELLIRTEKLLNRSSN